MVEPHRLVHTGRRWYLLAWDTGALGEGVSAVARIVRFTAALALLSVESGATPHHRRQAVGRRPWHEGGAPRERRPAWHP